MDLDSLNDRLTRLERSSRRWKCLALVCGGGLTLSLLIGGAPASDPAAAEIRTHKLTIVDEQGRTTATLAYNAKHFSGLECFDSETGIRVSGFGTGIDNSGAYVIATKKGENVIVHSGMVTDKGVPYEKVLQAQESLRRATLP